VLHDSLVVSPNNKLNWHSYLLDLDGISSREQVLVVDHSPVLPSEMRGLVRAMLTRPAKGLLSAHGCNVRLLNKLTMAYLIDGFMFLFDEFPSLINSPFFQKVSNFVTWGSNGNYSWLSNRDHHTRGEEVLIPDVILVACREFGQRMVIRIKIVQELLGTGE
jgi:hypothetical protein